MDFDDLMRKIGEFGPYQKRVLFLALLTTIFIVFEAYGVVFIFFIPPHRCAIPGLSEDFYDVTNDSHVFLLNHSLPLDDGAWSQCDVYSDVNSSFLNDVRSDGGNFSWTTNWNSTRPKEKCGRWVFDHSVFQNTIPTDMSVVCGNLIHRATSNMMAELGCLVGTLTSGFLADRYGRKLPFFLGGLCLLGGGMGLAFATSMLYVNICRFVVGVARMTIWSMCFFIIVEIIGPSKRVLVSMLQEFIWCIGIFILLGIAYFIRNWRYLEIAVSVPAVVLIAYWWLIPESPRWLASKGRYEEALVIVQKIAQSNKRPVPQLEDLILYSKASKTLSWRLVFTSRELTLRAVIVFSNMIVLVIIFYALMYNVSNLQGDLFLNFLLNGVLETVGLTSPYFLLDRLGRKPVYCACTLLAGLASVLSAIPALLQSPGWVVVALSLTGRFFACMAFSTLYLYGAELFPTVIRGSVMGVGVGFSRIGALLAPFLADVGLMVGGPLQKVLPLLVMGSPALVAGIFALWLPETRGVNMPEALDDVIRTDRSRGLCCKGKGHAADTKHCPPLTVDTMAEEMEKLTSSQQQNGEHFSNTVHAASRL